MGATTLTVYADSSVIGGCEDDEFSRSSRMLIDRFTRGHMTLALSPLTLRELDGAPKRVRDVLDAVPPQHVEMIDVSHEAEQLAGQYIERGVLNPGMLVDALHIAVATLARRRCPRELELQAYRERESAYRRSTMSAGKWGTGLLKSEHRGRWSMTHDKQRKDISIV